jgi:hypothetical protein
MIDKTQYNERILQLVSEFLENSIDSSLSVNFGTQNIYEFGNSQQVNIDYTGINEATLHITYRG